MDGSVCTRRRRRSLTEPCRGQDWVNGASGLAVEEGDKYASFLDGTHGSKDCISAEWDGIIGSEVQSDATLAYLPQDCYVEAQISASPSQSKVSLEGRTTLMLRNIPNDYSRKMILNLLDDKGFASCYDFLYLPIDYSRGASFGYAFVNCTSSANAERMKEEFQGFNEWLLGSQKICSVCWGEPLQGLEAHVQRYRNSSVMHPSVPDEYKPFLLVDGIRSAFPAPTKRIRPPKKNMTLLTAK